MKCQHELCVWLARKHLVVNIRIIELIFVEIPFTVSIRQDLVAHWQGQKVSLSPQTCQRRRALVLSLRGFEPGLFSSFLWEQRFDKVCERSRTLELFEGFDVHFWETGPWAPSSPHLQIFPSSCVCL